MHRGRTWSQRQLIGLGTPAEYNRRVMKLLDAGTTAISLIPCNSVYRGNDCDEVPLPLLGTCGTVVNTVDHMATALDRVPVGEISTSMNDPSPFTLLAFVLNVAQQRNVHWQKSQALQTKVTTCRTVSQPHVFSPVTPRCASHSARSHQLLPRAGAHWNPLPWWASICNKPVQRRLRQWLSPCPLPCSTAKTVSTTAWIRTSPATVHFLFRYS
ncbi:MAG: hypothetical protein CM1200mP41_03890 [Gammaproteobacteria bacterium]|nr:MAG: hypothetical protein CM1200mP41_03890 [Gammaproteobacteria bacterium]